MKYGEGWAENVDETIILRKRNRWRSWQLFTSEATVRSPRTALVMLQPRKVMCGWPDRQNVPQSRRTSPLRPSLCTVCRATIVSKSHSKTLFLRGQGKSQGFRISVEERNDMLPVAHRAKDDATGAMSMMHLVDDRAVQIDDTGGVLHGDTTDIADISITAQNAVAQAANSGRSARRRAGNCATGRVTSAG